MDIGLETEVDECDICGRPMANCKFVGECEPETLQRDDTSDLEYREDMSGVEAHLDKRVEQKDLDPLFYNEVHISLLKRRVKQLTEEKNFFKTRVITLEKQVS